MGLDMYMHAVKHGTINHDDGTTKIHCDRKEIGYWRKVRHVHNFFEEIYRNRGGTEDYFNCIPLELTAEDLDSLEDAINTGRINDYSAQGFFFGDWDFDDDDAKHTLEVIEVAREYMSQGYTIEYDSWW